MYEFHHWPTPQEAGVTDPDFICEWEERVASCMADGGLAEQEARRVAWDRAKLGELPKEVGERDGDQARAYGSDVTPMIPAASGLPRLLWVLTYRSAYERAGDALVSSDFRILENRINTTVLESSTCQST